MIYLWIDVSMNWCVYEFLCLWNCLSISLIKVSMPYLRLATVWIFQELWSNTKTQEKKLLNRDEEETIQTSPAQPHQKSTPTSPCCCCCFGQFYVTSLKWLRMYLKPCRCVFIAHYSFGFHWNHTYIFWFPPLLPSYTPSTST